MPTLLGYESLRWTKNQNNEIKDALLQTEAKTELTDVSLKGEMYTRRISISRHSLKR